MKPLVDIQFTLLMFMWHFYRELIALAFLSFRAFSLSMRIESLIRSAMLSGKY